MTHPMIRGIRSFGTAAVLAAALGAAGCASLGGALGFGAARTADGSVVVANGLDQAVNVDASSRTGIGEIFVGQVAAGRTDTIPTRGVAPGQTVRLRAAAVSGDPQFEQEGVVVGAGAAWRIP